MTQTFTPAQTRTLATIKANGGEMNSYAGQPGFNANSVRALLKVGALVPVPGCGNCKDGTASLPCLRPIASSARCYHRVRIA